MSRRLDGLSTGISVSAVSVCPIQHSAIQPSQLSDLAAAEKKEVKLRQAVGSKEKTKPRQRPSSLTLRVVIASLSLGPRLSL
eukprot:scaffold41546_cov18-Tisochrysis_lutea.AAC.1